MNRITRIFTCAILALGLLPTVALPMPEQAQQKMEHRNPATKIIAGTTTVAMGILLASAKVLPQALPNELLVVAAALLFTGGYLAARSGIDDLITVCDTLIQTPQ
jgi:hypothetical protein